MFFTDHIEKYVPPRKGRSHVLRLIRDILYFEPEHRGTDPVQALEFLMHVLKRRAIVFLLSDLLGDGFGPDKLKQPLGIAARRHDLVVISVNDPAEEELPKLGLVEMEDAETGELATVDTRDPALRKRFKQWRAGSEAELAEDCSSSSAWTTSRSRPPRTSPRSCTSSSRNARGDTGRNQERALPARQLTHQDAEEHSPGRTSWPLCVLVVTFCGSVLAPVAVRSPRLIRPQRPIHRPAIPRRSTGSSRAGRCR